MQDVKSLSLVLFALILGLVHMSLTYSSFFHFIEIAATATTETTNSSETTAQLIYFIESLNSISEFAIGIMIIFIPVAFVIATTFNLNVKNIVSSSIGIIILVSCVLINYFIIEDDASYFYIAALSILIQVGILVLNIKDVILEFIELPGGASETADTQESPSFTVKANKTNSFIYLEKTGVKVNFLQFFEYNKFLASIAHNNVNNYALIDVETFNKDLVHLVKAIVPKLENPHEENVNIVNTASTNAKNVINALYEVSERKNISDEKRTELNDKLHNKLNDSLIDFMQETVNMYKIQRIEQETQAENIVNNVVI